MGSRSKRREQRNKRRRRAGSTPPAFDPHVQAIVETWAAMGELVARLAAADDPVAAVDTAYDEAVAEFARKVRRFDAIRLIEAARLAFLPMVPEGATPTAAEAVGAYVELLAAVALATRGEAAAENCSGTDSGDVQEMSGFLSEAKDEIANLLRLAQLRRLLAVDPNDKLALVSALIQGAEIWIRNPSYQEMVQSTVLALFDGDPTVRAALDNELGFDATDAVAVLNACHDLQLDSMNDRFNAMSEATMNAMNSPHGDAPDTELAKIAMSAIVSAFEPEADRATVAIDDVVARTGIAEKRVHAVVKRFRLELESATPAEVVEAFSAGRNPLRTRPLVVSDDGRIMLPHSMLNPVAVRESLEEHLKTSQAWEKYAKHRGDLLELRTRAALDRVLPDAHYRDAFEYYVPANDAEEKAADPARYTKRVEGDHLVVLDDVAIIVEDKAVALSALARGGKTARIRTDLTGIITKASEQARRMRDAIERDGGLRIEDEGWVDLRHIREIHTVAVSLDDLSTVLTATAELVRAGVLEADSIPWTVSLHDLELITELVARPAEFLLYLRRRRNPDVTLKFRASDELDLFLHFFESGLWVEPDPAQVRNAFPFLPEPSTAEMRRYRSQQRLIVSSRTDVLDRWFHTKDNPGCQPAPKPGMVSSPAAPLINELQSRSATSWLSIGATLLSGNSGVQRQFAHYGEDLLDNPSQNGSGRSLTVPLTASVDSAEGWLLVWATRPANENPIVAEKRLRDYLRAKKHQLSLPRGVVFLYDEPTRTLVDAFYDGHIGPLDAELTASLGRLRPTSEIQRLHPIGKRPPRSKKSASKKSTKRKHR
jgi:hypothetical protein